MKKTAKIYFLLFFAVTSLVAQTDSLEFIDDYPEIYGEVIITDSAYLSEKLEVREFDRDEWQKLTEKIDYTEEKIEEKEEPEPVGYNPELINAVGKILMWIIGAIGLAALIYIIVKLITDGNFKFKNDRKIKAGSVTYDLEEIEENLPDVELKTPIEKAVADGNFPLAVRLYYLAIIQELSVKDIITWKREKTNFEYIREMRGHRLGNDFRNVTQIFERVWYGENVIEETDFRSIQPVFLKMLENARELQKAISA